jgi:hypothetical protein
MRYLLPGLLNGRAALPRRPELGRSSSFALPVYETCGLMRYLLPGLLKQGWNLI